jgi:thiosulfate/3-mercaptopyruvate sulfurtransferase
MLIWQVTMTYTTLISITDLLQHLDDPNWAIIDCRFSLMEPDLGRRNYLAGHVSGAVYVHLDEDLSGPIIKGVTGRHPLPTVEVAAQTFSRLGIGEGVQVVTYDDLGGALAAGRAWWMLRWLGHTRVAVLDGGWPQWQKAGHPTREGEERHMSRSFTARPRPELVVTSAQVELMRQDPAYRVIDVRSEDRFRGENETIDPVAGHIPGAVSAAYADNLNPDGTFRTAEQLRQRYEQTLKGTPAENTIFYCGSGVTSTHGILAMMYAGLGEGRLYAGSWSEWITDPERPVARGAD